MQKVNDNDIIIILPIYRLIYYAEKEMGRRSEWYKSFSKLSFKQTTIDRILLDGRGKKEFNPKDRAAFDKYARAHFDKRPILENRETARKIGIEASSTYPKENLVNAIIDAIWGLQYFTDEREALELPDMNRFLLDSEIGLLADYYCGTYIAGEEVKGVFEEQAEGFGIIRTDASGPSIYDCIVPRRLVNDYLLSNGDVVVGRMHHVKKCKCMGMFYVDEVNGLFANGENYKEQVALIRQRKAVAPYERVILGEENNSAFVNLLNLVCPFAYGQSLLVSYSGKMSEQKQLIDLIETLERTQKFDEVITVCNGLNSLDCARIMEKTSVAMRDGNQVEYDENAILRMMDGATTRAKQGRNVVVVFADMDGALAKSEQVKKVMDSAKKYADGGSVSVIAYCDKENVNGNYSAAKRIAQAEFVVKFKPFLSSFDVDYEKCYSFSAVTLTKKEEKARKKLLSALAISKEKQSYEQFVSIVAGE